MKSALNVFAFYKRIKQTNVAGNSLCTHAAGEVFQTGFANLFELSCFGILHDISVFSNPFTVAVFADWLTCVIPFWYFNLTALFDYVSFFCMLNTCNKFPVIDYCPALNIDNNIFNRIFTSIFVFILSIFFSDFFVYKLISILFTLGCNFIQFLFQPVHIFFKNFILHIS